MRTIEAPGVEWKEYDLSQVAPAQGGPVALTFGFADKGQKETVYNITGSASDRIIFGTPKNDAERYFYKARMKVLNQNGSLLAAKIPYSNDSEGVYNAVDYTLSEIKSNSTDVIDKALYESLIQRTNFSKNGEALTANIVTQITTKIDDAYPNEEDVATVWKQAATDYLATQSLTAFEPVAGYIAADVAKGNGLTAFIANKSDEIESLQSLPDSGIERLLKFTPETGVKIMSEDALGIYRIGMMPEETMGGVDDIMADDSIRIVDIVHSSLDTDAFGKERLGTFPVIVAAGNVLLKQSVLPEAVFQNLYETDLQAVNPLNRSETFTFAPETVLEPLVQLGIVNGKDGDTYLYQSIGPQGTDLTVSGNLIDAEVETPLASVNGSASLAQTVMALFDSVNTTETGAIDTENTKYITIAVVEAYKDTLAGNKINFKVRESFTGSPWIGATSPSTGASVYLGDLINGTSNYIEFYSTLGRGNSKITQTPTDLYIANTSNKVTFETAFTQTMCAKNISEAQIIQSLQTIFNKCSNINAVTVDYVVDAGISNIAQYLAFRKNALGWSADTVDSHSYYSKLAEAYVFVDKYEPSLQKWELKTRDQTLSWRSIYSIYNTFCQNTRKDCMFLLDCLRPLTLEGSQKIVRPTKPSNNFDEHIYPKIAYLAGLNTSYGAGYSIWYYGQDDFTGDYIWLPPSIQAVGVNIYCDINANYWDAPAGLNRGILSDALDISYNPGPTHSGMLYKKGWNFMVNWPSDGITLEGQKTLQVKASAFDRINVRKLFLRLERQTYQTCRYFVYEPNHAFTRQRIIDAITPAFSDAKVRGGLYDYKLVCSEENNPADVIDRNELVVDIALKPTKTAEFILLNFYALRTGASWSEAGL